MNFPKKLELVAVSLPPFRIWGVENEDFSSSNFRGLACVFTPKELHHIAQGCSRSELPWAM